MRVHISETAIKKLFALSGNLCAFPDCTQRVFDLSGELVADVCHIEAANSRGERYNPEQSDKERNGFDNLVVLCKNHHAITNNILEFPVEKLKEIKKTHENRFISNPYDVTQNNINQFQIYQLDSIASEIRVQMIDFFNKLVFTNDSDMFPIGKTWRIPNSNISQMQLDLIENYEYWYHLAHILIQEQYQKKEAEFVELHEGKVWTHSAGSLKGYASRTMGIIDKIQLSDRSASYQSNTEIVQAVLSMFTKQRSILKAVLTR